MNKQLNDEKKKLTLEDFPKEEHSAIEKTVLNIIDSDVVQNPIKAIWKNPVGKVVLIVGGAYAALYVGGFLLRAGAYLMDGVNIFNDAVNGSGSA